MKSLLEISFKNCQELSYQNVMQKDPDSLDRILYENLVSLSRTKIKRALQKQKLLLIVRTIYLIKNFPIERVIDEILGDLENYKKSSWRLGMVHAIYTYISFKNKEDRLREIVQSSYAFFPSYGSMKEKEYLLSYLIELKNKNEDTLLDYFYIYSIFERFLIA